MRAADGPAGRLQRQQIDLGEPRPGAEHRQPEGRGDPGEQNGEQHKDGDFSAVKPSNCNTPAIWVTAATVEASTRNRYSQRRGAISGTAAVYPAGAS